MIEKITEEEFRKAYDSEIGGLPKAMRLLMAKINELVDVENTKEADRLAD